MHTSIIGDCRASTGRRESFSHPSLALIFNSFPFKSVFSFIYFHVFKLKQALYSCDIETLNFI
ncbi:unnamed protein product [Meloidogyne enterolobii]|uniref:Uncharacterized protein n=1 Tax=Meloidogyne enterolobii TaxID=390850 RepID=A0ACB0YQ46_MELEN